MTWQLFVSIEQSICYSYVQIAYRDTWMSIWVKQYWNWEVQKQKFFFCDWGPLKSPRILYFLDFPPFVNVLSYFGSLSELSREIAYSAERYKRFSFFISQGSRTLKSVSREIHILQPALWWAHAHKPFSLITSCHLPPDPQSLPCTFLPWTTEHARRLSLAK